PIPIKLKITVSGDTVDFDVTESADQTMGPVNCGAAQAVSALRVGYKLLVSPDSNSSGGSFRPLSTQVRSGSVLGAVAPAPGQWRGGNGVVREYEFLADCVVGLWFERSKTPAWGLFGGSEAQGPEVVFNPGRNDEVRTLKANARKVKAGDVVRLAVGGGGGFG